jgi:hypothetical protein
MVVQKWWKKILKIVPDVTYFTELRKMLYFMVPTKYLDTHKLALFLT